MNFPSQRKLRIGGVARFGLVIAGVVSGLLSIGMILSTIVSIVAVIDSPSGAPGVVFGIVLLLVTTVIAAGFVWLTIYLNGKLKQGQPPDPKRANPFACQSCGDEAPTIHAGLNRHIGMIVLMNHRSLKASFCKPCFMKSFWEYTLTTLFLGWWGLISFIITPVVLINNLVMLIRSFSLNGKPPHAIRPTLNDQQVLNLQSRRDAIAQRLASGETEESVTMDVANSSGLTPGQVYMFVRPLADGRI